MSTHIVNSTEMTPQCSVYTKGKSAGYRHDTRFEYRHLQSPFMGTDQSIITSTVKDATTKFYGYQERPQIVNKRVLPAGQFMERPLYAPNRKCAGNTSDRNMYVRLPQSASPTVATGYNNRFNDRPTTLIKTKESYNVSSTSVKVPPRQYISSIKSVPSRVSKSKEVIVNYPNYRPQSRTAMFVDYA
jgi:hypothetical protein